MIAGEVNICYFTLSSKNTLSCLPVKIPPPPPNKYISLFSVAAQDPWTSLTESNVKLISSSYSPEFLINFLVLFIDGINYSE